MFSFIIGWGPCGVYFTGSDVPVRNDDIWFDISLS